ncbi:hypothetical protein [Bacillus sp. T3]|uniref:hypothetical protein n=1 Tax=Bacillus sp. T3 TaxID=467262 RepID=UPI0029816B44|nr:hypothetical protein [Bacillus sp. T3]
MIKKSDVIERLNSLIGKELTSQNLHEALFCEEKHKKILRRYNAGTYTYVQYKIHTDKTSDTQPCVDITIPGNPNTFRVGLEERDGQLIVQSEARINYSYIN